LNTFLRLGDTEVARTLFHELAHQRLYVKGDSVFNESFATTVENEGLRRWLARNADPAQQQAFAERLRRKAQFLGLVETYRGKLRALYAAPLPDGEKRQAKRETMARMALDYAALKAAWGGDAGYDKWFETDFNNAKIAALTLYTRLGPAFEALLEQEGGDLPRFYRRVEALAHLPKAERTQALENLMPAKAPG
ncbi:MAG: aminopeptidase, partial [Sulfuricella sp.]|nr:aminopeptidase [Sulfuricella sp.]